MLNLRSGAYTALITPFHADGTFDEPTMRRLVNRQIDAGIRGLVPCGTTGEAAAMTPDEHEHVVRTVVEQAAGRVPVIAGAGCNNTAHAIELSQRCAAAGADALLHVTPYYVKPTQEGLRRHFLAIAEAVDVPIVLYNVPGRTGVTLQPRTILTLAEDPRIIAVKQAVPDLEALMAIVHGRPSGFAVFSGEDALAMPMVALGADGVISVVCNEAPAQMAGLICATHAGHLDVARGLQRTLLPLMQANFAESNPIPVKSAMARLGLAGNHLRLPLTPLAPEHVTTIDAALATAGLIGNHRGAIREKVAELADSMAYAGQGVA
jgi:4-hydroxy-tetrahydrodipicolinate synthase